MDFFFDKQYRNYWMGLSILWIVLLHISQNLNNEWFSVFFGKGYLGVDVFFMLSTYGLACSYERNNIYNFYKNRFIRLFPEYLIYLLVLFLFFGNHFTDSLWLLAIYQCTGLACFRNVGIEWYIPALILLYVTFPLFYRVVKELYNRCWILSILIIPLIGLPLRYYGWMFMFYLVPSRIMIAYVTLLLYFAIKQNDEKRILITCIVPAVSCFVIGSEKVSYSAAYYLPMLMFLISMLNPSLPFGRKIRCIGKYTLEIYLAQSIALQYFAKYNPYHLDSIVLYLLSFALITILTIMFHYANSIWKIRKMTF